MVFFFVEAIFKYLLVTMFLLKVLPEYLRYIYLLLISCVMKKFNCIVVIELKYCPSYKVIKQNLAELFTNLVFLMQYLFNSCRG